MTGWACRHRRTDCGTVRTRMSQDGQTQTSRRVVSAGRMLVRSPLDGTEGLIDIDLGGSLFPRTSGKAETGSSL
ncbi:hypothetical protein RvY_00718 [Ramazzottius varieornatus]|uniref:Uncharacterized protein n=1 Tax=Ramazzottius varieornatus TaxID=947166 RepID=A0A1D1UHS4_RAMVA|nr:hypothetical protein RvY_00718 [Ramazzottius varieornatus]